MENPVYCIAGGTSLKGFDFSKLKDKTTICVNKAIFDVPNPDIFVTMDYTFLKKINREKFDKINAYKVFIKNHEPEYMKEINGILTDIRTNLRYHLKDFDQEIDSYYSKGLGFKSIHFKSGNNSGFCALQLAVILGYTEIYLLGYDLQVGDTTHYHSGYSQDKDKFQDKLDEYFGNFVGALQKLKDKGINVYTCSNESRLRHYTEFKVI